MFYINANSTLNNTQYLNPHFPGADWNVSALFEHDDLIFDLIDIMQDLLDCPNPIGAVHGSLPSRWNSGMPGGKMHTTGEIESLLLTYNKLGVKIFLTFSNHLLEKSDLDDKTCHYLLDILSDLGGKNGVIVSSDLLSDYIGEHYPELQQISSLVKISVEHGKGNVKYYQDLLKRFNRVAVHPDDNGNQDLLKQLEPGKLEILVNEPCIINCPNRETHYHLLARLGRDCNNIFEYDNADEHITDVCAALPLIKQLKTEKKQRNNALTFTEMNQLHALGISHFTIQGRNKKQEMFLYDLVHYLFEPDYIAPLIFRTMLNGDYR